MRRAVGTAVASLALLIAVPGAAQAAQRYAAPGGAGTACTQATPCSLQEAIAKAGKNDEVIVTAGTYTVNATIPASFTAENLFIHGDFAGPMPKIDATINGNTPIAFGALGGRISYLDITNTATTPFAALCLPEGSIDRVRATSIGSSSPTGVIMLGNCSVRDSLIRAVGANGVALSASGSAASGPGLIRNVTALAAGTESVGIRSAYNEFIIFGSYLADVKNTVAEGSLADLQAFSGAFGPGNIAVSNSNFDKAVAMAPATITGGPNQSAPPRFVDAAAGDFRQAPGSPTIDAGSTDGIGALDLDGNARNLGAAPDIGAFELVPSTEPAPVQAAGTIQSLGVKPRRFRVVNAGGAIVSAKRKAKKAPVGTTVTYFVSAPATVEFTVERETKGRKVGGKCKKATRANRDKKECSLFRALKPSFTHFGIHNGVAAGNSFRFSGRIGGKALRPGKYRISGKAGGSVKRSRFQIVR